MSKVEPRHASGQRERHGEARLDFLLNQHFHNGFAFLVTFGGGGAMMLDSSVGVANKHNQAERSAIYPNQSQ
jgi:hypothetical protein